MIRRVVTDTAVLDLSHVHTYTPAVLTFAKTLPPAFALALFSHDAHTGFVTAVTAYVIVTCYSLARQSVFLFDTSAIAMDTLMGMILMAVANFRRRKAVIMCAETGWCAAAALYKISNPPHDRLYAPWAAAFTCAMVIVIVMLADVNSSGFTFDSVLGPSRVLAYATLAVLDGYATSIYASRRDGAAQRVQMSLFLHGSILFAPSSNTLLMMLGVLIVAQGVSLVAMVNRDTSKKNDVEAALTPPRPLINTASATPSAATLLA
eukprot:946009-Rhodomonas_salina.1